MRNIRRKSVALAGVVGVIAASALAAAAAAPASAATNIKVGTVAINAMGTIPWGQASGVFAKNGLNVTEIKIYPAPPPSLAALAAGAVDFDYAPSIAIINAYANAGMALKVVAPADGYPAGSLTAAKKSAAAAAKLDDTDFATLHAHGFNDEDIWDIGAITAFFGLSNRMANLSGMLPNPEFYLMGRVPRVKA